MKPGWVFSVGWMDRPHSGIEDDQGTHGKTATLEDVAMEQRLLELWEQLTASRRCIALEVLEDMVVSAQYRTAPSLPPSPLQVHDAN
ncbi:MAG: hypothetical protein WBC13_06260 [Dokdonella sp.]